MNSAQLSLPPPTTRLRTSRALAMRRLLSERPPRSLVFVPLKRLPENQVSVDAALRSNWLAAGQRTLVSIHIPPDRRVFAFASRKPS